MTLFVGQQVLRLKRDKGTISVVEVAERQLVTFTIMYIANQREVQLPHVLLEAIKYGFQFLATLNGMANGIVLP
jgi:hypothetical protein